MKENYEFLVEKEAMWAGMLMQVLEDNGIPCASLPAHGAGIVTKAGGTKIYVPRESLDQAQALLDELFSAYEDEF